MLSHYTMKCFIRFWKLPSWTDLRVHVAHSAVPAAPVSLLGSPGEIMNPLRHWSDFHTVGFTHWFDHSHTEGFPFTCTTPFHTHAFIISKKDVKTKKTKAPAVSFIFLLPCVCTAMIKGAWKHFIKVPEMNWKADRWVRKTQIWLYGCGCRCGCGVCVLCALEEIWLRAHWPEDVVLCMLLHSCSSRKLEFPEPCYSN